MDFNRESLGYLQKVKEETEVTAKAIIGIAAVVVVIAGLAVMWIRGRRKR